MADAQHHDVDTLRVEPGDVIVLRSVISPDPVLLERLRERWPEHLIILLALGGEIDALGSDEMRRHGWVRTEQLRAMVKLLGADEMTPTAKRQLLSLCAEND